MFTIATKPAVEQLFISRLVQELRKVTAVRALRDARFIPARFLCRSLHIQFHCTAAKLLERSRATVTIPVKTWLRTAVEVRSFYVT